MADFGECVLYTPANSAGKGKSDVRWKAVRSESGESVIGTSEGVAKAGDFRRKPENGRRWNVENFDNFVGVSGPWSERRI